MAITPTVAHVAQFGVTPPHGCVVQRMLDGHGELSVSIRIILVARVYVIPELEALGMTAVGREKAIAQQLYMLVHLVILWFVFSMILLCVNTGIHIFLASNFHTWMKTK